MYVKEYWNYKRWSERFYSSVQHLAEGKERRTIWQLGISANNKHATFNVLFVLLVKTRSWWLFGSGLLQVENTLGNITQMSQWVSVDVPGNKHESAKTFLRPVLARRLKTWSVLYSFRKQHHNLHLRLLVILRFWWTTRPKTC